jgi:hypothetical protein
MMGAADSANIMTNALVWRQDEQTVFGDGEVTRIRLASPVVGRWVSVQNRNPDRTGAQPPTVLQVTELQVYGTGGPVVWDALHRALLLYML